MSVTVKFTTRGVRTAKTYTGRTAEQFKGKAADKAKVGFRPQAVIGTRSRSEQNTSAVGPRVPCGHGSTTTYPTANWYNSSARRSINSRMARMCRHASGMPASP